MSAKTVFCVAVCVLAAGSAAAQQASVLPPDAMTERKAGGEAILRAEKLLNGGEVRGPQSEACAEMTGALFHLVKAASLAGARTRVLDWRELAPDEQVAVKEKINGHWERNIRLRSHACTESPRP
ncbi:MAG: hypothetical protein Q8R02_06315 [Hyphomonadaceae bacterium]|nr:hypothetical protein [Hyphomonadaceae bacterium]